MPATAKTCILCGRDCSARPRVKDKDGRYACQDCIQKQAKATTRSRQTAPKSSPRPRGVDPVLDGLIDAAPAQHTCPGCSRTMRADAKVCLNCGYNTEIGRAVRTRVAHQKSSRKQVNLGPLLSPAMIIGVGLLLFAALAGLTVAVPPAGLAFYFLLFVSLGLAVTISYAVFPFMDGSPGRAIVNLILGVPGLFWIYTTNHREWLRAICTVYLVAWVGLIALFSAFGASLDEFEAELDASNARRDVQSSPTTADASPAASALDRDPQHGADDLQEEPAFFSLTAQDATRDGEDPAMVEKALCYIAEQRVWARAYSSVTNVERYVAEAEQLLAAVESIEDFRPEDIRYTLAKFKRMSDEERGALLTFVETGQWPGDAPAEDEFAEDIEESDSSDEGP